MNEQFDSDRFGPVAARLLAPGRVCDLGPGKPNREALPLLKGLRPEGLFAGQIIADRSAARACIAGIWLYHDFLDESHAISQEIDTPEGSFWHGIMHRREPDYSNAKYWFRRVGEHPVFEPLRREAADLAQQSKLDEAAEFLSLRVAWDPYAFVDLCEAVASGRSNSGELARAVQMKEWELLFDYCWRRARS